MRVILDAGRMENRDETFAYLKEQFKFPDYYGNNLDALHDCLTELRDTVIVMENEEQAGMWFKKVKRVLLDACRENQELTIENTK